MFIVRYLTDTLAFTLESTCTLNVLYVDSAQ